METRLRKRYQYKQNRFQQLRGFYHTVVAKSLTGAAERMALEQPTVTLQIQALERELKTKLFHRKRGGLVLTEEGKALFDLASPAIQILESLDQTFERQVASCESGQVIFAAPDAVAYLLLPTLVSEFSARFPNVEMVLLSRTAYAAMDLVVIGECDFSIGAPLAVPDSVLFQPLVNVTHNLVVPYGHPLAEKEKVELRDLADYPLIAPVEEGSLWQGLHEALSRNGMDCRIIMRLESSAMRLQYVERGVGNTIAYAWEKVPGVERRLKWIPLVGVLAPSTFGLMTLKNTYLTAAARELVDYIVAAAPELQAAADRAPED